MKILIFNWRDIKNPEAGGAEVFTHEIAQRLVLKGNKVTIFTAGYPGCKKNEVIDGVEIVRYGSRYTVYIKAPQFYREHAGEYDVVVDEINTRPFMTPKFVKDGTPVLALIHQLAREFWFYETPFPINWIGNHILEDRWLKNYIDIPTITVSQSTKNDLIDLGFKEVMIIPEGISFKPLPYIPEKEKEPTLIFVGRMGRAKLPDHVMEAFAQIKCNIPNAKLWMVGDGKMRKQLGKNKPDDVTFFGYVDGKIKHRLMSRAHAILVPGVREGWCLVVSEANAMGTPAVGYNVNGLRDSIIDGETGLLCETNPLSMAEKANNLLKDDTLRERLSRQALKWAGEFSWDNTANEFLRLIELRVNG